MYISEMLPTTDALRLAGDTLPDWARARLETADDLRGRHNSVEDRINHLEWIIDSIDDAITKANWRTGKKAELRDLIQTLSEGTDYNSP